MPIPRGLAADFSVCLLAHSHLRAGRASSGRYLSGTRRPGEYKKFDLVHFVERPLIAGILILVMPRLLNYIVAFYLIVIGLVGLFGLR